MRREFGRGWDHVSHLVHDQINGSRDCLDNAFERIMRAIEALPCAQGNVDEISLALSEALANAVVHGNREDPVKRVDVCATCIGDLFSLVITDEGDGFDPTLVPDPTAVDKLMLNRGRGLFLIRRLMDQIDFRLGGRQIVMTKIRQNAAERVVIGDEKEL